MKILYNAQFGSGYDQRISTRDVCVVTRQPLLCELLKLGHEITFTNKPLPPTNEDIEWCEKNVEKKMLMLNIRRVKYLDAKIKVLNDFDADFNPKEYDCAITELRTELYFHDGLPKDVQIQRKIWNSGMPHLVWDKDCWGIFEKNFINIKTGLIVGPTESYEICNPGFGKYHKTIDFGIDEEVKNLGSFRSQDKLVELGYIGSEYNRLDSLARFYAKPSKHFKTRIVGKMYEQPRAFIKGEFLGRTPILSGKQYLDNCLVTTHIAPAAYAQCGHMTYRIFEATAADCALLADGNIFNIRKLVKDENLVYSSTEVEKVLGDLNLIHELKDKQTTFLKRTFREVATEFEEKMNYIIEISK